MDVERRARRERDLALDASSSPAARARHARAHEGGVERRTGAVGTARLSRVERDPEPDPEDDDEPDVGDERGSTGATSRSYAGPRRVAAGEGRERPGRPPRGERPRARPARIASAAASSSLQLLECLDRLVFHLRPHIVRGEPRPCEKRREPRRGSGETVARGEDALEVLLRRLGVVARPARGRERALDPRVGADHRAPRVALRRGGRRASRRARRRAPRAASRRAARGPGAGRGARATRRRARRRRGTRSRRRARRRTPARSRRAAAVAAPASPGPVLEDAACARRRRSARPRAR